jgi:7-keto-8-aminopelargonate synthetase-like enzyme
MIRQDVARPLVFEKCLHVTERLRAAAAADRYCYFRAIDSAQEPEVVVGGRRLVMLGSNNYLGLTSHPKVKEAAVAAVRRFGTGCAGSRLLNGTLSLHETLEGRLAQFTGKPAAVTFSTGFQVNLGVISCLLDRGDAVYLDKQDHASIIDGARLSFAKTHKFAHNDPAELRRLMVAERSARGRLVVVDGVFSMEGDIAPLPDIVEIARDFGAAVMVDDAHGLGVLGRRGRGTAEHFDLESDVHLIMGTFSKSLASIGGFIAGEREVIDHIRHSARSLIFSAALAPASAAAAAAAVEIVQA